MAIFTVDTDIHQKLISILNDAAEPLSETGDYSSLLEKIGDARFVMIGEASHGTHEFYQKRIEISQQLIKKKGFMAVAIEGDWPDVYRMHRYIQGKGDAVDGEHALNDFKRFPTWMWRNTTMPLFLKWLRQHNDNLLTGSHKVGIYGLDLYSINTSMQAVIQYLMKVDPDAAQQAKIRYACFDHLNIDPQMYGYLTTSGVKKSCIDEVIDEFYELQHRAFKYINDDGITAEDECFFAAQNARLVKNAEAYSRAMFEDHISSRNIRDHHMVETLTILADHLEHDFRACLQFIFWFKIPTPRRPAA